MNERLLTVTARAVASILTGVDPYGGQGKMRAEIISILDQPQPPNGWRVDWDNAPRDGTEILIGGWQQIKAELFTRQTVAAWDVEDVGGDGGWAIDHGLTKLDFVPEFWMPIPELPSLPR